MNKTEWNLLNFSARVYLHNWHFWTRCHHFVLRRNIFVDLQSIWNLFKWFLKLSKIQVDWISLTRLFGFYTNVSNRFRNLTQNNAFFTRASRITNFIRSRILNSRRFRDRFPQFCPNRMHGNFIDIFPSKHNPSVTSNLSKCVHGRNDSCREDDYLTRDYVCHWSVLFFDCNVTKSRYAHFCQSRIFFLQNTKRCNVDSRFQYEFWVINFTYDLRFGFYSFNR